MKILLSLLGLSPGVATGAYYALFHGWGIDKAVQVDKVVTLATNARGIDRIEDEIQHEFKRWHSESGINVLYDDKCRVRIMAKDLSKKEDVEEFRNCITGLLKEEYKNDEVHLVVAGGRKSMAALAAVTAQLYGYGVKGMYHLCIDENLEKDGSNESFWHIDSVRQREVMRPPLGLCNLVSIPYLQFKVREKEISLTICGEVQDYIIQYLDENPGFIPRLEKVSSGRVYGYMFEVKVKEYLEKKGGFDRARHHYCLPGYEGDIDVYAEKNGRILICECKFFENYPDKHFVTFEKVEQIVKGMNFLRDKYPDAKVEAWVVSNAESAHQDAWDKANQWNVKLKTTGSVERRLKKTLYEWSISQICDMLPPENRS